LKGKKKSEALHQAKVDFIAKAPPQLQDPYYWAGLVVIGSDEALFSKAWYKNIYVVSSLFLLLIGGIYFMNKK